MKSKNSSVDRMEELENKIRELDKSANGNANFVDTLRGFDQSQLEGIATSFEEFEEWARLRKEALNQKPKSKIHKKAKTNIWENFSRN